MSTPSAALPRLPRLSPPHLGIPSSATHLEVAADGVDLDIAAHRAEGVRKALDHLASTHTSPAYRRQRAVLALGRAVEMQARTAGIGHVHVGTGACGAMCEALPTGRARHSAKTSEPPTRPHDTWLATEDAEIGYAYLPCCSCGWTGPAALRDSDAADLVADEHRGSAS